MNVKAYQELKDYILSHFDVTPEELLNASGSFSSLIELVVARSGKSEKEVRDLLNIVVGNNSSSSKEN